MQTIPIALEADGALVDIVVGLSSAQVQLLRQAGKPVPPGIALKALIDSGADGSCVDVDALSPLQQAGLQPKRVIPVNMPALGGLRIDLEYSVNVTLLHPSGIARSNLVLRDLIVVETPIGTLGYQCLLGRDVLRHCLLIYNGPDESATLVY